MDWFLPRFSGRYEAATEPAALLARFRERAARGLLSNANHRRDRYRTEPAPGGGLRCEAASFATAINVGLNRIELRPAGERAIDYEVRYPVWTAFAAGMGGLLGVLLAASWFLFDIGGRLDRHDPLVGPQFISPGRAKLIFWGLTGFWGLLWPWLLAAFHKPFARRALLRVLRALDG